MKIHMSMTSVKPRSSVKCVLSLKSRLRAVHGLLALICINSKMKSPKYRSLKSSRNTKSTWIESSTTTLSMLFKFFWIFLPPLSILRAGLGDHFGGLANFEYFLYEKWGFGLTPYQRSACTQQTDLEVGLCCVRHIWRGNTS